MRQINANAKNEFFIEGWYWLIKCNKLTRKQEEIVFNRGNPKCLKKKGIGITIVGEEAKKKESLREIKFQQFSMHAYYI